MREPGARSSASSATAAPSERSRAASRRLLITSVLIAGFVLTAFAFVFAFPTGAYLDQRSDLADENARLELLRRENAALEERAAQLETDEEVERLARERFDMVRPGEDAYAILPPPTTTAPPATSAP